MTVGLFSGGGIFCGKRGLTPLVATFMLIGFALIVGTLTMNWGRNYVEGIKGEVSAAAKENVVLIELSTINTPLKQLQLEFLLGKMNEGEYLVLEKSAIGR
ncbi:hypothetical protein HYV84_00485 [Candidatus Woesearchaeota archaeon]|nr:hypothetical protein [Candidatus Woesearchaeota archaeon]